MVLATLPTKVSNYLTLQKPWRSYKQPDVFLSEGGSTTQEKSTEEKITLTPWTPCPENAQRLYNMLRKNHFLTYLEYNEYSFQI